MLTMKFAVALAAVHAAAALLSVASAQIYNASFVPYTVNKELLVWPINTPVLSGESACWVQVPQQTEPCVCLQASQASGYGVLNFTQDMMHYEVRSCTSCISQGGAGCATSPLTGAGSLTWFHTAAWAGFRTTRLLQGGAGCSTFPHRRWGPLTCAHAAAQVWLYGVAGLRNVEIHIAAPGTHGDVVAVLYAAAFANATAVASGLVARGFQKGHDFLGPLLLPLAQHLDASFLQTRRARPPCEGLAACWYKQPT